MRHMKSTESSQNILQELDTEGAVIIDSLLSESLIEKIKNDLRPYLDASPDGINNFSGKSTKRIGALMARSPACRDLALNSLINELCSKFLEEFSDGYQLNFTQAIEISPSETTQPLHRDRGVWGNYLSRKIETQFSTVWAISDFTEANGATRIVPGSHKWEKDREATEKEIVFAEMPSGSVLLYGGSILHGGGANTTKSEKRLAVLIHYSLSWLRQEENQYLSCPPNIATQLPSELRSLMGYSLVNPILGFFSPHNKKGVELVSPKHLFDE